MLAIPWSEKTGRSEASLVKKLTVSSLLYPNRLIHSLIPSMNLSTRNGPHTTLFLSSNSYILEKYIELIRNPTTYDIVPITVPINTLNSNSFSLRNITLLFLTVINSINNAITNIGAYGKIMPLSPFNPVINPMPTVNTIDTTAPYNLSNFIIH